MPGSAGSDARPPLVLLWENFGPYHHDRARALAARGHEVHGIELATSSRDYHWDRQEAAATYTVQVVDDGSRPVGHWRQLAGMVRLCWRTGARHVFLCHYDRTTVLIAATILRLGRRRVFTMVDSKFDDYPRVLWRELVKSLYLRPYSGALVASRRSREYLAFLGFRRRPIAQGYDTIDIGRFAAPIAATDADAVPFAERPFVVVARLVPKKNIATVLTAFAAYRAAHPDGRELHIIGYGPLREELEERARALGIDGAVRFAGTQQTAEVARVLAGGLVLILASTEEQFGLVVNEALAAGAPVIVSAAAGAVDELVDNLANGIIVDPRDPDSIVRAMAYVSADELRWRRMRERARASAVRGDVARFCDGVAELIAGR